MAGIDPFELVRRTTDLVEKAVGDFLERRMRDPEAMKLMGQATSLGLDMKRQMLGVLEHVHRAVDLPTRRDVEALSASINSIESRLIDIEDRLDDLAGESAPGKRKRRVEKTTVHVRRGPHAVARPIARAPSRRPRIAGRRA